MEIDRSEVISEIRATFDRYEAALDTNDVAALAEFFWTDPRTVRLGPGGGLYGHAAIAAFRRGRDVTDLKRQLLRVSIIAIGHDVGVASAEYRRTGSGRRGGQTQTWVRFPEGWRIVAAHVSLDPPEPTVR